MALLQVLTIVVFANAVDVVLSCGGGSPPPPPPPPPPPCSWTTCKNVFKDDWAPPKAQGRCVEQLRSAHPDPTLHNGQGSCPAPQPCSNVEPEYRLLCSCRSASCVFQQWGPWEGALPSEIYCESACGCEKRTRGYTVTWSYVSKVGRCGPELQPQCPPPDIEKRKRVC